MQPRPQATFLGILAALALALGCLPATAESISVGDLRLQYGPPWQRGDAEEEARAESVILRRADAPQALTVMLPRHHARLRLPEERFYRQLEAVWRAQYGQAARVDWLDAGGLRWRMVRRPSLDRPDAVVFHLVTVIDGRAHHLLAHAPASAAELPEGVLRLLTDRVDALATTHTPTPSDVPAGTATPPGWRLDRVLRIHPGQSGLDQVLTMEHRAVGGEGMITGLELKLQEHGLNASLQGFVWVAGADRKEVRREFMRHWEVSWTAPPQLWQDGQTVAIVVDSATDSDRVGLDIRLRLLCGAADQLRALLDAVERGPGYAGERLQAGVTSCRDRAAGFTQAETVVGAGETARPILIELPATPALSADEQGLLVLSLQPRAADGPGQALLGAASVHYVYVRGH
ncbi:MAG: hypothetical protein ACUVSD_10220 [Thiobacillaceae bacterium]